MIKKIIEQGAECYRQGIKKENNPYHDNDWKNAWEEGWQAECDYWEKESKK